MTLSAMLPMKRIGKAVVAFQDPSKRYLGRIVLPAQESLKCALDAPAKRLMLIRVFVYSANESEVSEN